MSNISVAGCVRAPLATIAAALLCSFNAPAFAQTASHAAQVSSAPPAGATAAVEVPPAYVIGPQDVLGINFWRDTDMTGDVTVRPDGRITLPLIGEIQAAGLTPEALKSRIMTAATKLFKEEPAITVVVRQINSRKVFITGMVAKSGDYSIPGRTTVLQLIAMAGGLHEFADAKNITINRTENGRQVSLRFNYKDVSKGKNLKQNIELKPGDTIIVP